MQIGGGNGDESGQRGGLVSQAFTALSARRGSALGRSLSRLEPQVANKYTQPPVWAGRHKR